MYEPVLDLPKVRVALELSDIHEEDWPMVSEHLDVLFWAQHRTWTREDVAQLEASVALSDEACAERMILLAGAEG